MVSFRYILGKTARERQYSWDTAPVKTQVEPELRRGIEVLATWYEYYEDGRLIPIAAENKHFYKDITEYVGTTKVIEQPSHGKLKLEPVHLVYLNQQLMSLIGIQCKNI